MTEPKPSMEVLIERDRCASILEAAAVSICIPGGRTNQVDRHVADVLRRYAVIIRTGE